MTYQEWSARGQYNSDKAKAAWDFAENQIKRNLDKVIKEEIETMTEEHVAGYVLKKYNGNFEEMLACLKAKKMSEG